MKQTIEWKAPARFDQVLELSIARDAGSAPRRSRSRTDFRIAGGDDRVIVTVETVYVLVDAATLTKLPLPDALRAALDEGAAGTVTDHAALPPACRHRSAPDPHRDAAARAAAASRPRRRRHFLPLLERSRRHAAGRLADPSRCRRGARIHRLQRRPVGTVARRSVSDRLCAADGTLARQHRPRLRDAVSRARPATCSRRTPGDWGLRPKRWTAMVGVARGRRRAPPLCALSSQPSRLGARARKVRFCREGVLRGYAEFPNLDAGRAAGCALLRDSPLRKRPRDAILPRKMENASTQREKCS